MKGISIVKSLLFIWILLVLSLQAANPKLYAPIGNPLFDSLSYTKKISKLYAFERQKQQFNAYITQLQKAKTTGLRLDEYAKSQEINEYRDYYLSSLRKLEKLEIEINNIIKSTTLQAIQNKNTIRFYAIMETKHPFLQKDPTLNEAITRYQYTLKQQKAKALQAKQVAEQKRRQHRNAFLHSFANLKGVWQGIQDDTTVKLHFLSKTNFIMEKQDDKHQQIIKGNYRLNNDVLNLTTSSITNINVQGTSHTRNRVVNIPFLIKTIDEKTLSLQPKHHSLITLKK